MAPTHLKVFAVEAQDRTLIVTPQGDTEAFRYQDIHVETNSLLDFVKRNRPDGLLVDFSSVDLIGSLMFASLIKLARHFEDANKVACFCSATEPMQQALHTMRITSKWSYFENRVEALEFLDEQMDQ